VHCFHRTSVEDVVGDALELNANRIPVRMRNEVSAKSVVWKDRVPRVRRLSVADFQRDYVRRSQPVIISDIRLGPRLDDLRTQHELNRRFGAVKVEVHPEYYGNFLRTGEFYRPAKRDKWWTIERYIAHLSAESSTSLLCTEQPLPQEFVAHVRIPKFCRYRYTTRAGIDSRLFLAGRGNFAHLHFDTDFNQVLLHAVVGRRQIVLLPPRSMHALNPIGNMSTVCLQNMTADERKTFARDRGGVILTLHPGETLYVPPRVWHFVLYMDNGMSINFRWGRSLVDTMLLGFPGGTDLQAVSSYVYEQGDTSPHSKSILRELRRVSTKHRKGERSFLRRRDTLRWISSAIDRDTGLRTDIPLRKIIAAQERMWTAMYRLAKRPLAS
jgi:hypothetical protein